MGKKAEDSNPAEEAPKKGFSFFGYKDRIKEAFSGNGKSKLSDYPDRYKGLFSEIKNLKSTNKNDTDIDRMGKDFQLTMKKWGVTEEEIPAVQRGLLIESFSMLTMGSLAFIFFIMTPSSLLMFATFILLTPIFFISAVMRYWRWNCIRTRQFVPFKEWLFG